jgi:hypothetical protein
MSALQSRRYETPWHQENFRVDLSSHLLRHQNSRRSSKTRDHQRYIVHHTIYYRTDLFTARPVAVADVLPRTDLASVSSRPAVYNSKLIVGQILFIPETAIQQPLLNIRRQNRPPTSGHCIDFVHRGSSRRRQPTADRE